MADQSQKTEKPTPRRIQKAREKGNFLSARQLLAGAQFFTFVGILSLGAAPWFSELRRLTRALLTRASGPELSAGELAALSRELLWRVFSPLALGGLGIVAVVAGCQLLISGGGISANGFAPKFERLNPVNRLKSLRRQNLASTLSALVLLPLFLYTVYSIARDNLPLYLSLPLTTAQNAFREATGSVSSLLWKAAWVFLSLGVIDLLREQKRYMKDLRMSKQEIQDELKETEGNPQIRARMRRLQREMLRRHMLRRVPQATAVIVNPTHFAVALRYEVEATAAPLVIAKGKNHVALRIRRIAIEHGVPIVENPPLAQALFQSVDVGQEIPAHLYRAVAEVLAYIYKLLHGHRAAPR